MTINPNEHLLFKNVAMGHLAHSVVEGDFTKKFYGDRMGFIVDKTGVYKNNNGEKGALITDGWAPKQFTEEGYLYFKSLDTNPNFKALGANKMLLDMGFVFEMYIPPVIPYDLEA